MSNEDLLTVRRAIKDVHIERKRQELVEGWSTEHDDEHDTGAMAAAGASYALSASSGIAENEAWRLSRENAAQSLWPWDREWWKPGDRRRMLVKAAALIIAEIERLDRKEHSNG